MDAPDKERIMNILLNNQDKEFVKRVLNPSKYPVMNNPDGSVSTHRMAWGEADGRYAVFPTLFLKNGKLVESKNPFQDAVKSGNVIYFDTPEEADWFSKQYKQIWRK